MVVTGLILQRIVGKSLFKFYYINWKSIKIFLYKVAGKTFSLCCVFCRKIIQHEWKMKIIIIGKDYNLYNCKIGQIFVFLDELFTTTVEVVAAAVKKIVT